MITVLIMIGIFWVVNVKTRNYFVIFYYTERYLSGYLSTTALILFIYVGFLEYLSFKQFKLIVRINNNMHVKITRIKSLFTLYMNVKIVTAKNFWMA
jgi:hypothetical protein